MTDKLVKAVSDDWFVMLNALACLGHVAMVPSFGP